MRARTVLALLPALTACGESSSRLHGPVFILDPSAFRPVPADLDPLSDHRPSQVDCPPGAWGPERGSFEVQTGVCDYGAFAHPLPMDLDAGDELYIMVWHDLLDAAEPGLSHVAVWVGSTVVWERWVEIPARSQVLEAVVSLPFDPPPRASLGLHLHNHGFNSWRLVSVEARTPGS